jgi:hypothetical protein
MTVSYNGIVVGDYLADMVVDSTVIIELKVAREITRPNSSTISAPQVSE